MFGRYAVVVTLGGILCAAAQNPAGQGVEESPRCVEIKRLLARVKGQGGPDNPSIGGDLKEARERIQKIRTELQSIEPARKAAKERELAAALEDENRHARTINRLEEAASRMRCQGAAALPADITGGGGSIATRSEGSTETTTPPGGGETKTPEEVAAGIPADKWIGTWKHSLGEFNLRTNLDPSFIRQTLANADSGPAIACPEDAQPLEGEITWTDGPYGRWTGRIYACARGGSLHAKFNNNDSLTLRQMAAGSNRGGWLSLLLKDETHFEGKSHPVHPAGDAFRLEGSK